MTAPSHFDWNVQIRQLPGAHFLQTKEWAEVKAEVGWRREEITILNSDGTVTAAAQLLIRSWRPLPLGPSIQIGYVPRGPLADWHDPEIRVRMLTEVEKVARKDKLVFVKIDPEIRVNLATSSPQDQNQASTAEAIVNLLTQRKWKYSPEQVQFKNTMVLNLTGDEASWLARMKPKTRYNLRLALKNGVTVRKATREDLPLLYQMYAETAHRDGFIIRPESYYLNVWSKFMQADMAEALIAEWEGVPLAGLVMFILASRCWYVYGMSTGEQREKMPNYLLQWEAMRIAQQRGCMIYDLWGAPDQIDPSDRMYGVYRFKEGLGAEFVSTIGAWDFPIRPGLYFLYHQVIPCLLSITRLVRRKQIQQEVV